MSAKSEHGGRPMTLRECMEAEEPMKSETPLTEAVLNSHECACRSFEYVSPDDMRDLERSLAAKEAECLRLRKYVRHHEGCDWYNGGKCCCGCPPDDFDAALSGSSS